MIVEFVDGDRSLCRKALELLEKKCDKLRDELEFVACDSMQVQALEGRIAVVLDLLDEEEAEADMPHELRLTLGLGLRLFRDKLMEETNRQVRLLVEPKDTLGKVASINDLLDRLGGQISLFARQPATVEG